jgi:hypothetical protein
MSEQPPRLMFGRLTAREHAVAEARRWQLAHGSPETTPDEEAYHVIVGLLQTVGLEELTRIYEKAGLK